MGAVGQEALVALAEDEVVNDAVAAVDNDGRPVTGGQGADVVLGVVGEGVGGTLSVAGIDGEAVAHHDVADSEFVLGAPDALFKGAQTALDVGHAVSPCAPPRPRCGG